MNANILKDRVQIQVRTVTMGATGETVVWKPVACKHARVIPLRAEARAAYQQLNSVVSHKIVFNKGAVDLTLGNDRILHGSKTYEPVEPTQDINNTTVVAVKEV